MSVNQKAFLDMIAFSEIGTDLLAVSDNGYNVIVGSTPGHPILFQSYADHPNVYIKAANSTAAGRYQLIHRYWPAYKSLLNLPDYSPESQDAVALQQIKECKAIDLIDSGWIEQAIGRCAHIWASFPGANYNQHENTLSSLIGAYTAAGGTL